MDQQLVACTACSRRAAPAQRSASTPSRRQPALPVTPSRQAPPLYTLCIRVHELHWSGFFCRSLDSSSGTRRQHMLSPARHVTQRPIIRKVEGCPEGMVMDGCSRPQLCVLRRLRMHRRRRAMQQRPPKWQRWSKACRQPLPGARMQVATTPHLKALYKQRFCYCITP